MDLIGVTITGIIGLLGKFFAPGDRDNIPLWLTVVCGIGGVLIGYYLAAALGVEATCGIDWIRWIISIIVAAVLVIPHGWRNSSLVRAPTGGTRWPAQDRSVPGRPVAHLCQRPVRSACPNPNRARLLDAVPVSRWW